MRRLSSKLPFFAGVLAVSTFLVGCASTTTTSAKKQKNQRENHIVMMNADGTRTYIRDRVASAGLINRAWEWNPHYAPSGTVEMEIVLNEQRLYVYRNGTEIGHSTISTGREGQNTRPGEFKVLAKNRDHVSNRWGTWKDSSGNILKNSARVDEPRPPGVRWEGSPMPYFIRLTWDGVGLHEGFLPGYPASAGCIRVHDGMAKTIFDIAKVGTPVRIVYDRPFRRSNAYATGQYPML